MAFRWRLRIGRDKLNKRTDHYRTARCPTCRKEWQEPVVDQFGEPFAHWSNKYVADIRCDDCRRERKP